jgi:hypothetical protein
MGPLSWEELSHDVIVASHFSPVVGIHNLEGSVHRGFLPRLKALDWNQPVIISADQNRQIIRFRARVQSALWTLSRLPYFVLAMLLANAWFLLRRRRRVVGHQKTYFRTLAEGKGSGNIVQRRRRNHPSNILAGLRPTQKI